VKRTWEHFPETNKAEGKTDLVQQLCTCRIAEEKTRLASIRTGLCNGRGAEHHQRQNGDASLLSRHGDDEAE
jgi:hypothetical protein